MSAARGGLFVISGPSGVGKGTVVRGVLAERPELDLSVSATTRAPRPGEEDGVHYRFLTPHQFAALVQAGAFLEHAEVFGARYGTIAADVEAARAEGRHVLLEIDVQGAAAVRARVPDAVLVFLRPPSEEELARRLRDRGTESGKALERRLAEARREMAESAGFDYIVVNEEISAAVREVLAIIDAHTEGATPP